MSGASSSSQSSWPILSCLGDCVSSCFSYFSKEEQGYSRVGSESETSSLPRATWNTLTEGITIGLSYTLSASIVAIGLLSRFLPGNKTTNYATGTLIMTVVNSTVYLAVSPMLGLNYVVAEEYGKWMKCVEILKSYLPGFDSNTFDKLPPWERQTLVRKNLSVCIGGFKTQYERLLAACSPNIRQEQLQNIIEKMLKTTLPNSELTHICSPSLSLENQKIEIAILLYSELLETLSDSTEVEKLKRPGQSKEELLQALNSALLNNNSSTTPSLDLTRIMNAPYVISPFSLAFSSLVFAFSKGITTKIFGASEEVGDVVETYSRTYAISLPFLLARLCFEQVMFGLKKQLPAAIIGNINFAIGLTLSILFSFGWAGFPKLNFTGMAVGFGIESILTSLGFGLYLIFSKYFKGVQVFRWPQWSKEAYEVLKAYLNTAVSILGSVAIDILAPFMTSFFAALLGQNQLAAQNVMSTVSFFCLIFMLSIAQATSQNVAIAQGQKHREMVRKQAIAGLLASLIAVSFVAILALAHPEMFALFGGRVNEIILRTVKSVLPVLALGLSADTARNNMQQVLRTLKVNFKSTAVPIVSTSIGLLLAYLLGFKAGGGLLGVTWGITSGFLINALATAYYWWQAINGRGESAAPQSESSWPILSCLSDCVSSCFSWFSRPKQEGYSRVDTETNSAPSVMVAASASAPTFVPATSSAIPIRNSNTRRGSIKSSNSEFAEGTPTSLLLAYWLLGSNDDISPANSSLTTPLLSPSPS